jgi:hypothetical protein
MATSIARTDVTCVTSAETFLVKALSRCTRHWLPPRIKPTAGFAWAGTSLILPSAKPLNIIGRSPNVALCGRKAGQGMGRRRGDSKLHTAGPSTYGSTTARKLFEHMRKVRTERRDRNTGRLAISKPTSLTL